MLPSTEYLLGVAFTLTNRQTFTNARFLAPFLERFSIGFPFVSCALAPIFHCFFTLIATCCFYFESVALTLIIDQIF